MKIKEFLVRNDVKGEDLAKYLSVSKTTVSNWSSAGVQPKKRYVEAILNNPYGWDTSMLEEEKPMVSMHTVSSGKNYVAGSNNKVKIVDTSKDIPLLNRRIADLEKQLEEEKARSAQYWEMIQNLIKK